MMKIAQIVHNPTAGNGSHSKEKIENVVKDAGYSINYVSTDEKNWEGFYKNKTDIIFVAGGDGSVHKLAEVLLRNKINNKLTPIRLLPLGTANNIAKTLQISTEFPFNSEGKTHKFDCGQVTGFDSKKFFLESMGVGIFPELILEMEKQETDNKKPSEKFQDTIRLLLEIVRNHKAEKTKIKVDGFTIKGSFLMVEFMNIRYIGPNLDLAPNANTADGFLDLVMIPEQKRSALEDYLEKMINGKAENKDLKKFVKTVRAQKVKMKYKGSKIHVDDNLIRDYSGTSFRVEVMPGALEFIY